MTSEEKRKVRKKKSNTLMSEDFFNPFLRDYLLYYLLLFERYFLQTPMLTLIHLNVAEETSKYFISASASITSCKFSLYLFSLKLSTQSYLQITPSF